MTKTLNGNLRVVMGIVGLLVIGAGIVTGYARLGAKADATCEDVAEIKAEQFLQWIDIDANNDRGIRIEVQVGNIEEKVDKILDEVEKLHE